MRIINWQNNTNKRRGIRLIEIQINTEEKKNNIKEHPNKR